MRHWRHRRRMHGQKPPPFVRNAGCVFAGLIALSAVVSSSLVTLFARTPQRRVTIIAIALAIAVAMVAGFAVMIGRMARFFREQDDLRRQLMADVAHELRTPLAILQGRIEGLLDGVYPRDDARLGELLAETQHLARLVEDVRTLANAEAGALDLRKERVDVAELIRDALRVIPSEARNPEEKGAGPERLGIPRGARDDTGSVFVECDPVRIREVLLNLLANAVEHGGRATIGVEARSREVVIRVHDDGPGIPADELPHVFDRFRKGRQSRGSGLGLSIARKLVLAHGGDLRLESRAGEGTTVTVTLPR